MLRPRLLHLALASCLCLTSVSRAGGLTYWFDKTCDNQLPGVEDEFKEMAKRSIERISDKDDYNQQSVFKYLYRRDSSDQATLDEVKRVENGIAGFSKTTDRQASDVRIYCDDDSYGQGGRWQPVGDIKNLPKNVIPNSQKTRGKDQEFYDPINGIRMSNAGDMGCKDLNSRGVKFTMAETFTLLSSDPKYSNENSKRSSITICDLTTNGKIKSLGDLPKDADITALPSLDALDPMASLVMLHEFTHTPAYDKVDNAYKWKDIQALDHDDAMDNSDTYAYFGLMAKLADRDFILAIFKPDAKQGRLQYQPFYTSNFLSLGGNPLFPHPPLLRRSLAWLFGKAS